MQYGLEYTDTEKTEKTLVRGTSGTLGTLELTVLDDNGDAFNFTGMTTVAKIYIGVEGTLLVDGVALTSTTAASGLVTFTIPWSTFADSDDCGVYSVEIYLADNAAPTKAITARGAYLTVNTSIID